MEIQIKNFLGIEAVSIPLASVPVLVNGPNASGKTSLATACAAILSRNYNPLSLGPTKRPYIRDTAETGEVLLVGEGGTEYRRWLLHQKGINVLPGGPEDVNKHVLGLTDFVAMPSKYRVEVWESCFLPSPRDLVALVGAALREQLSRSAAVDEVLSMLRTRKWEECENVFRHKATEAKREWQELTGENYGGKKADRWTPAGWRSELDTMTPVEARTHVEAAAESLRIVRVREAVSEAEVERAAEARAEIPNIEKEIGGLKSLLEVARDERNRHDAAYSKIRDAGLKVRGELERHDKAQPIRDETTPCPACGEALVIGPDRSLIRARDEARFNAQLGAWTMGRDKIADELQQLRVRAKEVRLNSLGPADKTWTGLTNEMSDATSRLQTARRLAGVSDSEVVTAEDQRRASEAEQAVEDRRKDEGLLNRKVGAQNAHMNVVNYSAIAYALGPRGIRSTAMGEKMGALTERLDQIAAVTAWPKVELDTQYSVVIGGRPGMVSSQSERWRAQFMLQAAVAIVLEETYLIADGADILDRDGRIEFVALCEWLADTFKVYTIVCATGSFGDIPARWRSVSVVDGRSVGENA